MHVSSRGKVSFFLDNYTNYGIRNYINLLLNFYCVTPFPCRAVHQTLKKAEKKSIQGDELENKNTRINKNTIYI